MQSESRITQQELASLFPDGVPMPIMKMIFPEKSEKLTVDDIRYILNAMRSEAALSTDAEPVKTATAVAVKSRKPKLPPIGNELYEFYPSMSAQTHADAVKDYARAAVSAALSAQVQDVAGERWIDVNDKLPGEQGQDSEEVSVFLNGHCGLLDHDKRKGGGWGYRTGFYDADIGCFRVHGRPDRFVTHWMPLPASPASKHGDAE